MVVYSILVAEDDHVPQFFVMNIEVLEFDEVPSVRGCAVSVPAAEAVEFRRRSINFIMPKRKQN